jgi:hypothetical protein
MHQFLDVFDRIPVARNGRKHAKLRICHLCFLLPEPHGR